jgi:predicted Fe-Mo cluster-binding NifX family protein
MRKVIALPIESGVLCGHFGHCEAFIVFETDNKQILSQKTYTPPAHEPGLYPAWIAQKGVTDVIAGGMGQKAIDLFNNNKINVFTGANKTNPEDLVNDFLNDKLECGANYCDH